MAALVLLGIFTNGCENSEDPPLQSQSSKYPLLAPRTVIIEDVQRGSVVRSNFTIKNQADEEIVAEIKPGCGGCTKISKPRVTLGPNSSAEVAFEFDLSKRTGGMTNLHIIDSKGNDYKVQIEVRQSDHITFLPRILRLTPGNGREARGTVKVHLSESLRSPSLLQVKEEQKSILTAKIDEIALRKYELEVCVQTSTYFQGPRTHYISIIDPKNPGWLVKYPVKIELNANLQFSPKFFSFQKDASEKHLTIHSDSPFKIVSAECRSEGVTVDFRYDQEPPVSQDVIVRLLAGNESFVTGLIEIQTNAPHSFPIHVRFCGYPPSDTAPIDGMPVAP